MKSGEIRRDWILQERARVGRIFKSVFEVLHVRHNFYVMAIDCRAEKSPEAIIQKIDQLFENKTYPFKDQIKLPVLFQDLFRPIEEGGFETAGLQNCEISLEPSYTFNFMTGKRVMESHVAVGFFHEIHWVAIVLNAPMRNIGKIKGVQDFHFKNCSDFLKAFCPPDKTKFIARVDKLMREQARRELEQLFAACKFLYPKSLHEEVAALELEIFKNVPLSLNDIENYLIALNENFDFESDLAKATLNWMVHLINFSNYPLHEKIAEQIQIEETINMPLEVSPHTNLTEYIETKLTSIDLSIYNINNKTREHQLLIILPGLAVLAGIICRFLSENDTVYQILNRVRSRTTGEFILQDIYWQENADSNFLFMMNVEDLPVRISVELGVTEHKFSDVQKMGEGSIVQLKNEISKPLLIKANGMPIAFGETLVVDDQFAIRITDIIHESQRAQYASEFEAVPYSPIWKNK